MEPKTKAFWEKFETFREILRDFYKILSEDKYDFRMVDNEQKKSDSPRESLAHILEINLTYLNGLRTGTLEFKDMGVAHYWQMSKDELLAEMQKIENQMREYLSSAEFDPNKTVNAPWGEAPAIDILYALVDHEILHQGWNLAIMDHLGIERFESLKNIWG